MPISKLVRLSNNDDKSGLRLIRRLGESVVIGTGEHEAIVYIEQANNGKTCLRIVAGKNTPILRGELQGNDEFFASKSTDEFGKY